MEQQLWQQVGEFSARLRGLEERVKRIEEKLDRLLTRNGRAPNMAWAAAERGGPWVAVGVLIYLLLQRGL